MELVNIEEEFRKKPPVNGCGYHFNNSPTYCGKKLNSHIYCGRKLLDGSKMCFWHAKTQEKYKPEVIKKYFQFSDNLQEIIEMEISKKESLEGAYLRGPNLRGPNINGQRGANLSNANLYNADLSEALLSYGSLRNADLGYANLESAYLGDVDLTDTWFVGAQLFNVKFRNNNFTTVVGLSKNSFFGWNNNILPTHKILEKFPEQSHPIYRKLIKYFSSNGNNDDASRAAYKERILYRKLI